MSTPTVTIPRSARLRYIADWLEGLPPIGDTKVNIKDHELAFHPLDADALTQVWSALSSVAFGPEETASGTAWRTAEVVGIGDVVVFTTLGRVAL